MHSRNGCLAVEIHLSYQARKIVLWVVKAVCLVQNQPNKIRTAWLFSQALRPEPPSRPGRSLSGIDSGSIVTWADRARPRCRHGQTIWNLGSASVNDTNRERATTHPRRCTTVFIGSSGKRNITQGRIRRNIVEGGGGNDTLYRRETWPSDDTVASQRLRLRYVHWLEPAQLTLIYSTCAQQVRSHPIGNVAASSANDRELLGVQAKTLSRWRWQDASRLRWHRLRVHQEVARAFGRRRPSRLGEGGTMGSMRSMTLGTGATRYWA